MRKNNNVNLAQVIKFNASKKRQINESELVYRLFHIMCNSDRYQSKNNYEANCLRIVLFPDGIMIESLYSSYYGSEWSNEDEMFLQRDEIPVEYRKVRKLYIQKEFNYGDAMWLLM